MTKPGIDYRRLLIIYMEHIGRQESTDFMSVSRPSWISASDWAELVRVSEQPLVQEIDEA